MKIYLIIVISIIIHLVLFYIRKYRFRNVSINSKLPNKNLTKTDLFSIKSITKSNHLYKVLIVEDDLANRKILKAQLTAAKYSVLTAKDGESALKLINSDKKIDVVLLDLMLPDISGFNVCKSIRENFTMYQKPVIMVTSKNYIKDLVEGFSVGANDFVTKPYNIYELIARINSSLSLKRIFEDNTSLKRINKLKSDIVDMAAHDLKSPLTLISGYANRIVKSVTKKSSDLENANKIVNSSNKMLTIINKLLNDSKYENQIMNFEDLNIGDLIVSCIDFYEDMAKTKNQKINFYYYKPEILVNIDKTSFITIFDNLISNAIKYSPVNSHINIRLDEKDQYIQISIKDSGNGFTQDEIDNLFIKFFPFTNKPTQGENSTGLGLYIINDMVNRNNGTIKVNSIRGEGSEFLLSFPKA